MKTLEISSLPIPEIEQVINSYPWFSLARMELLLKVAAQGEECRKEAVRKELLYLYPARTVFRTAYCLSLSRPVEAEPQIYEFDYETGPVEEAPAPENGTPFPQVSADERQKDPGRREIVVVGGDYFTAEDFKELKNSGESPFFGLNLGEDPLPQVSTEDMSEFRDENFYTETLARIYTEQELYDRAYEVYDKLILLYPEKSVYFATLKDEIKKHL